MWDWWNDDTCITSPSWQHIRHSFIPSHMTCANIRAFITYMYPVEPLRMSGVRSMSLFIFPRGTSINLSSFPFFRSHLHVSISPWGHLQQGVHYILLYSLWDASLIAIFATKRLSAWCFLMPHQGVHVCGRHPTYLSSTRRSHIPSRWILITHEPETDMYHLCFARRAFILYSEGWIPRNPCRSVKSFLAFEVLIPSFFSAHSSLLS